MGKPIENPISKPELEHLYLGERMSAIRIAKIKGVKYQQIYYLLSKYGIPRRSDKEKSTIYSVNHDYFSAIDTEERAYWLGFMYADGYVTKRNVVGLSLAIKDLQHLERFKLALQAMHPIRQYTSSGYKEGQYCRLAFPSDKMTNDLERLGCVKQKTLILQFPSEQQVPPKFMKDFIRGYLDGDGCITGCNGHGPRIKICGTMEMLEGIRCYFNSLLPKHLAILSPLAKRHHDDKNNYSLEVGSTRKSLIILQALYKDATVFLTRKYEKYSFYAQKLSSLSEMVGV